MNTATTSITTQPLDRRQFLKLAAVSLLVAAGCTTVRHESDLDAAMSALNQLLDEMEENEQQQVTSIAQRIQARARELADEHRTFIDSFDRQLRSYDTPEAELERLIETYGRRRTSLRDDLLHLQDELHAAMTPDDWSEVVQVLNRAGKSLAGYTLSGG